MRGRGLVLMALAAILLMAAGAAYLLAGQSAQSSAPDDAAPAGRNETAAVSAPERVSNEAAAADLDPVLVFRDPAECEFGEPLASIVAQMVRTDPRTLESRRGGPIRIPGFGAPFTPTFERTRELDGAVDIRTVNAALDLPGLWHGLRIVRIRQEFQEESDYNLLQIEFDEPAERVREVLNRYGFRLAPVGEGRPVGGDGLERTISVDRLEQGGTALACGS